MDAEVQARKTAEEHGFWKSAGMHLLERNPNGWLAVTDDFIRAYLTRPEVHPIDESGPNEVALFESLMADPMRAVSSAELDAIEDADARDNYRIVLDFRDVLVDAGTVEGAYLSLVRSPRSDIPAIFIDQLINLILRNILSDCREPIEVRAGEIFFREQNVNTDNGQLMLADEEIVDMYARTGGAGSIGQLLVESGTSTKSVELDVLDEDNKQLYWARSDRFDTVVDFRFTQPALDGFARNIERWLKHLTGIDVTVQPRQRIDDDDWRWHIGLDSEGTRLLNMLYQGQEPTLEEAQRIVCLLEMRIADDRIVIDRVRGKPIYLGLAMSADKKVRMKPQNLIVNLPLLEAAS